MAANKKVWITALSMESQKQLEALATTLGTYGLAVDGHFWDDNLQEMSWGGAREPLRDEEVKLWLILARPEELEKESVRFGLSLLAIAVQQARGNGFPILVAGDGGAVNSDELPTPLAGAEVVDAADPTLGAKMVAKANMPAPKVDPGYRLRVYPMAQLGLWFEVGPTEGSEPWSGAIFGVTGEHAAVDSHGVGPEGKPPQKAVLNYPMKDLKLALGESEYVAWAVRNAIDPDDSYFVRVQGMPEAMLFGELGDNDQPDLFVLKLH